MNDHDKDEASAAIVAAWEYRKDIDGVLTSDSQEFEWLGPTLVRRDDAEIYTRGTMGITLAPQVRFDTYALGLLGQFAGPPFHLFTSCDVKAMKYVSASCRLGLGVLAARLLAAEAGDDAREEASAFEQRAADAVTYLSEHSLKPNARAALIVRRAETELASYYRRLCRAIEDRIATFHGFDRIGDDSICEPLKRRRIRAFDEATRI